MERRAWFCPSCQKHHGPHVDTCPGDAGAQPRPEPVQPSITPIVVPREWYPDPNGTPWVPRYPTVICMGAVADPNTVIMNGVAATRVVQ